VVHVGISTNQEEIEFIPPPRLHVFPGNRQEIVAPNRLVHVKVLSASTAAIIKIASVPARLPSCSPFGVFPRTRGFNSFQGQDALTRETISAVSISMNGIPPSLALSGYLLRDGFASKAEPGLDRRESLP
jgi:hypothetical protein